MMRTAIMETDGGGKARALGAAGLFWLFSQTVPAVLAQDPPSPPPPPGRESMPEAGAEKERIRPVFEPGLTYRFVRVTTVNFRIPGGAARELRVDHQARYDAVLRPKGKEGIRLSAFTERLVVDIAGDGVQLHYDSMDKATRGTPLGQHLQAEANRRIVIDLDSRGRIVEEESEGEEKASGGGGEGTKAEDAAGGEIRKPGEASGVAPGNPEGEAAEDGGFTSLEGLPVFGAEELEDLVATLPQPYPIAKVAEGGEWTLEGTRRTGAAGELVFSLSCRHLGTVIDEQEKAAQIEYRGTASGDSGTGWIVEALLTGTVYYDALEKMTRRSLENVRLSLSLPVPGSSGENVVLPMEQKVETRLLHIVPTGIPAPGAADRE